MKLFYTVLLSLSLVYSSILPQQSVESLSNLDEIILNAHPGPSNNGGSANWAIFFNLIAGAHPVYVTKMTTSSQATAGNTFSVEIFTIRGNALGGPVGSGPGSSSEGWTSLGTAEVTQGSLNSGISLPYSIPTIFINSGDTIGVAVKFLSVGPRYYGTSTVPHTTYSDNYLSIITGDVRTLPFTPTGSFFTSRELVGAIYYDTTVVPVELISFTASILPGNSVELKWATATELNNSGFYIEKRTEDTEWENTGYLVGHGTSTETNYYTFIDKDLKSGSYFYRLKQTDFDGLSRYYNLAEIIEIGLIKMFDLSQNYPNPFNPSTVINFQLNLGNHTNITIYDYLGKEVAVLINEFKQAGIHQVEFNASGLASGVYFYKIVSGEFTATRKMLLMK
jgi:hypothetical protein